MAVHDLCGSLSEPISWISTKYCIVLMRALISMGRLLVFNSMTEYGVVLGVLTGFPPSSREEIEWHPIMWNDHFLDELGRPLWSSLYTQWPG